MPRHLLFLLPMSAVLAACGSLSPTPTASRHTAASWAPQTLSLAAGPNVGVAIDGAPTSKTGMAAWDQWTNSVGQRSQQVLWFTDWATDFPAFAVTNAYSRNATPVITWEMQGRRGAAISYGDVLAGGWNTFIDRWARAAKTDGREILLRFGHEMNGNWYGWSGARNGGDSRAPAQFVQVWRYVHGRFAALGVTNVRWVWTPNHASVPGEPWNAAANYYPGDAYVDWVGADGYNWGTSQTVAAGGWDSGWQSFAQVFGPIYAEVTLAAPSKPFMIGEFACAEQGGSKSAWIQDAARQIKTNYPAIRALNWFNYDKETDWRVESSPEALTAFQQAFAQDQTYAWAPR